MEEDNVVDLWSYKIKKSAKEVEDALKKKRDDENKRREELSVKQSVTSKIQKALDKFGSFRGKKEEK